MRHTMKLAVMVIAVAVAVMSGLALAQTDDSTAQDPVEQHQSRVAEGLAPLVEDGTISQEQADAIGESLAQRFADRMEQKQERRAEREAYRQELLDELGVTAEELRAAIADGATLGEIADANGSNADAVVDLLVGHAEERLADAVTDERLTQAEADEKLAEITEQITDKVNNGGFGPGFGPGHRHDANGEGFGGRGFGRQGPGGQGFGGFGGGAPDAPAEDASINA